MPLKPSLIERALEATAARMDRWTSEDLRNTSAPEVLRMLAREVEREREARQREAERSEMELSSLLDDVRGNGQS